MAGLAILGAAAVTGGIAAYQAKKEVAAALSNKAQKEADKKNAANEYSNPTHVLQLCSLVLLIPNPNL